MYDGSIVIGTELATDKFDKQIVDLEKKINKEEDQKIVIETKLSTQKQELDEQREKVDKLAYAYERLKKITSSPNEFRKGYAEYGEIVSEFGKLKDIERSYDKALNAQIKLEQQVSQTEIKYKGIVDKVEEYKQKIETINMQKQKSEVDQLKGSIDKVGNSFSGAVKKAGKLALAIFGIRSAYMMLRRASSELATYDEQYATNLEYIRFVLTQAIAPVLKYIVNLAMQLLGWINAILQAWFGVNLFANGSVEAFQKMKKGASGVEKAVKQIKKQLLGFDEVNMLTDQSDTGTSAGAGGVTMPDFDMSAMQGEPPEWLKWIIDNKDIILAVLAGIATGLTLIKLGMSGIKALGFGLVVTGIVLAIQSLLKYLKDPSWENFGKIITGLGITVLGFAVIIGNLPVAVAGIAITILGIVVANWEKISTFLDKAYSYIIRLGENIQGFFTRKIGEVQNSFGILGNWILSLVRFWIQLIIEQVGGFVKHLKTKWTLIFTGIKTVLDGIIRIFKGDFFGGITEVGKGISIFFQRSMGKYLVFVYLVLASDYSNNAKRWSYI